MAKPMPRPYTVRAKNSSSKLLVVAETAAAMPARGKEASDLVISAALKIKLPVADGDGEGSSYA